MNQSNFSRTIYLLIKDSKDHFYFRGDNILSFEYLPQVEPWDNMATARYLYELKNNVEIRSDEALYTTYNTDEFKQILSDVNRADVVKTQERVKVFYINTKCLEETKLERINKEQLQISDDYEKQLVKDFIIDEIQHKRVRRRYAIIEDSTDVEWRLRVVNLGLFLGLYREENEDWAYPLVYKFETLSEEQINQCEGFVITGSPCTAYIQEEWYPQYKTLLEKIIATGKPIIGTCFGHQIYAEFFGGRTEKNPNIPPEHYVNYGVRQITLKGVVRSVHFYHGDHVSEVPSGCEIIGTSDYCPIQAYRKDNFLGVQFHPEFTIPQVKYLMSTSKATKNREQLLKSFDSSSMIGNGDSLWLRQRLLAFLKKGETF